MGCDIHLYVEYRTKDPKNNYDKSWRDFGGRINPGRNYYLFGKLAGVRSGGPPVVEPRGCPDDLAYEANGDWWLWIDYSDTPTNGDGMVSAETAERYASVYGKKTRGEFSPSTVTRREGGNETVTIEGAAHAGKPTHVQHPDWHTPSWLTTEEFATAISEDGSQEYDAVLGAMKAFEASGYESRVVFWFDN